LNVLVLVRRQSERLDWILEDIKDEYHPDTVKIVMSTKGVLSSRDKLQVDDAVVLVEPELIDLMAVYLFAPIKDIVVVDSDYRWFKTHGNKWTALKTEVEKELTFVKILLNSRMLYKSIYWRLMSLLRQVLSNISRIKILY
jgi:hypothetical protein